ncbi:DUF1534 domain-containing protein [Pseudomonas tremae]|uniref:DUF1534 domain-containing protein n=1 Tax=Pseudomonas coronafaciens pv. coronafaciens TaxID=235275 RepID=A0AAE6QHV3_9PSED|nr:DUF1534 domain-containing protein [Pseudomonas tremae]MCF5745582.1 DUF1534 domain-containing protein [Pseudomonas tremae]QGT82011.1 DUF1534 domain-containing protein [Pseudomonas coronafaciens pv. coronafaciens]
MIRDALRHKSMLYRTLKIGRRASRIALSRWRVGMPFVTLCVTDLRQDA